MFGRPIAPETARLIKNSSACAVEDSGRRFAPKDGEEIVVRGKCCADAAMQFQPSAPIQRILFEPRNPSICCSHWSSLGQSRELPEFAVLPIISDSASPR